MFKWLNKQGVEKQGEFFFQRLDRFHYEYGENGKRVRMSVEPGDPQDDIYLSDAVGSISEPEGKRIADNIAAALNFMGLRSRVR